MAIPKRELPNHKHHPCKHCRLQSERRRRKIDFHGTARQLPALHGRIRHAGRGLRLSPVVDPCPARTGAGGRRVQRLLQAAHGAAVQGYGTQNLARRPLHAHRSASGGRPHPARRLPPADRLLRPAGNGQCRRSYRQPRIEVLSKGLS